MVLILQGCGMRISGLVQPPLDCLTQDARGTFYLRFMQGKMKREHTIPVSQEIARVIQEQQQVVRATGRSTALLFPNSKGGVSKQQSFAQRINRQAYKSGPRRKRQTLPVPVSPVSPHCRNKNDQPWRSPPLHSTLPRPSSARDDEPVCAVSTTSRCGKNSPIPARNVGECDGQGGAGRAARHK